MTEIITTPMVSKNRKAETLDFEVMRKILTNLTKYYNSRKPEDFNDEELVRSYYAYGFQVDVQTLREKWEFLKTNFKFFPSPKEFGIALGVINDGNKNDYFTRALRVQSELMSWLRSPEGTTSRLSNEAKYIIKTTAPSALDLKNNQNYCEKATNPNLIAKKLELFDKEPPVEIKYLPPEDKNIKIHYGKDPNRKIADFKTFYKDLMSGIANPDKTWKSKND